MFVFEKKADLEAHLTPYWEAGKAIGLVPTMGAIHEGHLSLLKQSIAENDCTVISIFVNPTQFNNVEDLEKYPRNLNKDLETIQRLSDKVFIFVPAVAEMYATDACAEHFDYEGLELEMEGAQRPGHFDGVGTILKKLFQLIRPVRTYFGEKDFQQLQIVRKMVVKEKMDIEVIGCPIYRNEFGLAMSSRNERLSKEGLQRATFLYEVLRKAKIMFQKEEPAKVIRFVEEEFKNNPNFELEYFTIADEETLKPISVKIKGKKYRGFLVAHLENVRLIDNIALN